MTPQQKVCRLLGIEKPIIQAGMVWVSGAKLAAAAAEAGALGVIGAGSMAPQLLKDHLRKAKTLTTKPIAVNIPLLYSKTEEQISIALDEGVRIFITSAGSPKLFTSKLKAAGCRVLHVVSTPLLAKKCEDAGVDAVVCEGFEAGGHNGRDELTSMVLIPQVVDAIKIPTIAAGGIATGRQILAAFALGASGVQIGTAFVATQESSAHQNFKQKIIDASFDSTMLCMKKLVPVRLLKNSFYENIKALEDTCAPQEALQEVLGKGRAKKGMLDGDLVEGELEIGQVAGLIKDIPTAKDLISRFDDEYRAVLWALSQPAGMD